MRCSLCVSRSKINYTTEQKSQPRGCGGWGFEVAYERATQFCLFLINSRTRSTRYLSSFWRVIVLPMLPSGMIAALERREEIVDLFFCSCQRRTHSHYTQLPRAVKRQKAEPSLHNVSAWAGGWGDKKTRDTSLGI